MAGPSKTYRRKDTIPSPVRRTRTNSSGREESYLEWDLYQANHTPGQHVMDEQGICVSNPGMDADYYIQGQKEVIENFDGVKYSYEYADPSGRQGLYTGDTGERKIIPRSHVFMVGEDVDNTGEVRINLTGNITKHVGIFAINEEGDSYVAGGVVNAWTILQYSAKIVFVLAPQGSSNRATVDQMIKAPVYLREWTHTHPLSQPVLIDPRPITIDNLSAKPEWYQNAINPGSYSFGAAQYY